MTGVDLLKKIVPKNPNIVRMILSGFSDINAIIDAVNSVGIHKYLQKPWNRNILKDTFAEELERSFGSASGKSYGNEPSGNSMEVEDKVVSAQKSILKDEKYVKSFFGEAFLIKHFSNKTSSVL